MLILVKGPEPGELRAYRAVPGATYDGKDFTPVKDAIRRDLLRDQHALCCYCMRRISDETRPHPTRPDAPALVQMKVEHWRPQASSPELQLAWSNLLGACLGWVGMPKPDETCDSRKGDDPIVLDPRNPAHLATLRCASTGRLESTDPQIQRDLDERLNLNHRILVADRRAALDRALTPLKLRHPRGAIPEGAVRALVGELEAPTGGRRREHCGVLRLWAQRRFGWGAA